ncbi:MAG: ABC transporter substrate-binding protein [Burkholderiales bacterium]
MKRRTFSWMLVAGCIGGPATSLAQQRPAMARIGYLRRASSQPRDLEALRKGLREVGYVEGRNLKIEERYADGDTARLPKLVRELLDLKVDVLVVDGTLTVKTIRPQVGSTPVVFTFVGDPVKEGFVASLDRPGGNLTGLTNLAPQLAGKRLQLLREIAPSGRVAVLNNPANVSAAALQQFTTDSKSLNVDTMLVAVTDVAHVPKAFEDLRRSDATSLLVWVDAMFFSHRDEIASQAMRTRMPAIYPEREFCEAGGLVCYGPSISTNFGRAARYVDRILKGAKPGDLPVEQPTQFELVVNVKAAKALGISVPASLLTRADEVIER